MAAGGREPGLRDRGGDGIPAFSARPSGLAESFASRLGGRRPVAVFFAAVLGGFALLAAVSILLGLLVTDVLLHSGGVASADESFVRSLAADRTPFLTSASSVGSTVGGAPVLPILVGLVALVCALKRRWLIAGFAVFALALESATYRVTSLVVPRHRPTVHRLEDLPANASYPSGHTAASIAVYAGFVLLLTSRIAHRGARVAAWTLAVLLPVFVAMSRMYRGMHHPLDVAGGLIVGIGAVSVLLFACRAAGCAERAPARQRSVQRAGRTRTA
jgi:membrane-associated phospholipid phosphatase